MFVVVAVVSTSHQKCFAISDKINVIDLFKLINLEQIRVHARDARGGNDQSFTSAHSGQLYVTKSGML